MNEEDVKVVETNGDVRVVKRAWNDFECQLRSRITGNGEWQTRTRRWTEEEAIRDMHHIGAQIAYGDW